MDFTDFFATLREETPPLRLSPALQALWHDAHGNWDAAHSLVDGAPDSDSAWVHAYLHRKEGDATNAAYWYGKANKEVCETSLPQEWRAIASALLRVVNHRGKRRRRKTAGDKDL